MEEISLILASEPVPFKYVPLFDYNKCHKNCYDYVEKYPNYKVIEGWCYGPEYLKNGKIVSFIYLIRHSMIINLKDETVIDITKNIIRDKGKSKELISFYPDVKQFDQIFNTEYNYVLCDTAFSELKYNNWKLVDGLEWIKFDYGYKYLNLKDGTLPDFNSV